MNSFRSRRAVTLAELIGVGAALLAVVALLAPIWRQRARERQMKGCQENLTRIDGAKEQWALENNKKPGDLVSEKDLLRPGATGYLSTMPRCPSGHGYVIGAIATLPVCESKIPGHTLTEVSLCVPVCE